MRLLLAVSAASLLVVGCSSENKMVGKAKKHAKAMCACKTAKCAYDLKLKQREESKNFKMSDLKDLSESDMKKIKKASEEGRKCEKDIMKKDGANHPVVKKLAAIADEVCACKDKDCAKKANKKAMAKGMFAFGLRKFTKPINKKRMDCYMKLIMAKPSPSIAPKKADDVKKDDKKDAKK